MGLFNKHSHTTELQAANQQLQDQAQALQQRLDTLTENLQNSQLRYDQASVHVHDLLEQMHQLEEQRRQLSAWHFFEQDEGQHDYVYELRLRDGKYYVGSTSRLRSRIQSHFLGENENGFKCAYWTSAHHPLEVIGLTEFPSDVARSDLEMAENQATLKLMKRYGYQTVRGGHFTAVQEADLVKFLKQPANQQKYGYTPQEVGIPATPTAAPKQPVKQPQTDYLLKYLPKKRQSAILDAPADAIIAITMSHENDYLLFHRQRRSLNYAFKKLATGTFNVAADPQSCRRFDTVQEAIILTDCANSQEAEDKLDQRQKQLELNQHAVFREDYGK